MLFADRHEFTWFRASRSPLPTDSLWLLNDLTRSTSALSKLGLIIVEESFLVKKNAGKRDDHLSD
jgi:hypothetical protein